MTWPIDFNHPVTTDLYTAWSTYLQNHQLSLAAMLDPNYVTYSNQQTGAKRINSTTGLVEQWNGTAWAALGLNYLRTDGSNLLTGAPTTANNIAYASRDAGGTGRRILVMNASNDVYIGDVDSALIGRSLNLWANSAVNTTINGTTVLSASASTVTAKNTSGASLTAYQPGNSEGVRVVSDGGFISFYNSANSTRTGYLQGSTGAYINLFAENGSVLRLGTAATERARIDLNGNFGLGVVPSSGWNSGVIALQIASGGQIAFAGQYGVIGATNTYYNGSNQYVLVAAGAAAYYSQEAGAHKWWTAPAGAAGSVATMTQAMTLDINGNLSVVGGLHLTGGYHSIVGTGGNYNENLRLPRASNGYVSICMACDSSGAGAVSGQFDIGIYPSATYGGAFHIDYGGTDILRIATNGASSFFGGVATIPFKPGNKSGAVTLDCSESNVHEITLVGNMTGLTLSNPTDGQTVNIFITQDGTGSRTMSGMTLANGYAWPGGNAGSLSTAAGAVDLLVATYRATTGRWYISITKNFT